MEKKNDLLPIVARDEWLRPAADAIARRHARYLEKLEAIRRSAARWSIMPTDTAISAGSGTSCSTDGGCASGSPGRRTSTSSATSTTGSAPRSGCRRMLRGSGAPFFPAAMYRDRLTHGSLYKIHVHGDNGWHDRIPAYARRVVQDDATKNYTAQFWAPPEPF